MHADLTNIFESTEAERQQWLLGYAEYELSCEKLRRYICDVCKAHGIPEKIMVSAEFMKAHSGPIITGKIVGIPVYMDVNLEGEDTMVFHFKEEEVHA